MKLTEAATLRILGPKIPPEFRYIDLTAGWNLIGYLYEEAKDAMDVFAALIEADNLIIAKHSNGSAVLPEWDFNGIGNLEPGLGYQVKVHEAATLYFNE